MRDDEARGGAVCHPRVTGHVRQPVDGGAAGVGRRRDCFGFVQAEG